MKTTTAFISSYAKAPLNTALSEDHKYIGIMLEISKEDHTVVNADATFITELARDYFKRLVVGCVITESLSPLIKEIEENFLIATNSSLIVALKSAQKKYADHFLYKKGIKVER